MMPLRRYILSLSLLPLLTAPNSVFADHPTIGMQGDPGGPITTSTAQTLSQGQAAVSIDFQWINFDPVSNARLALGSERDEDIHSADSLSRSALNFAFGVSDKLTLGLSLPYIERKGLREAAHDHDDSHEDDHDEEAAEENHREEESTHEQVEHLGDANGFGDVQFYGSYQLSLQPAGGDTALLFGIKVPTGDTHEKSRDGERLETELQPGSGSWDPFLGFAYSRRWQTWSFDSNLLYTFVSEGSQDTNLGDIVNYNLSLSRPIYGAPLSGHEGHDHHHALSESGFSVSLVFEVNGEWRDRTEIKGQTEHHSGGNLLYFSPGLSIKTGNWIIGAAISVPLENLNGAQSEPETRFMLRLGRVI